MSEKKKAIRLHVTQERYERMTLNDLIALEEMAAGKFRARDLRDILARFVVDGTGYMPEDEAQALIGGLTLSELPTVAEQFVQAVEAFTRENVVPPGGGSR